LQNRTALAAKTAELSVAEENLKLTKDRLATKEQEMTNMVESLKVEIKELQDVGPLKDAEMKILQVRYKHHGGCRSSSCCQLAIVAWQLAASCWLCCRYTTKIA
jgi:hypothetical protein